MHFMLPVIILNALRSRRFYPSAIRLMSSAPTFKPFNLALIQLGQIGADKSGALYTVSYPHSVAYLTAANINHAREMILKAASGNDVKPDLIVLPVCVSTLRIILDLTPAPHAGMLQLALRPYSLPCICREYWVHPRNAI